MSSNKFFNFLGLFSVVALAVSFGPTPVAALDVAHSNHVRHADHRMVAKKRRAGSNGRCKPRTTSSLSSSSVAPTTTPAVTTAAVTTSAADAGKAAATTSSSAAHTTSAATTATIKAGSGKACLAWPNGDSFSLKPFVTDKVNHIYTWNVYKPKEVDELGLSYIPILWGTDEARVKAFTETVKAGYSEYVAGFNEPQEAGQSNLSVDDAIKAWRQYIQPLKAQGFKLICPATSSNPNGFTWVSEFLEKCPDCTCDVIALHYYDISAQGFKDYVMKWRNKFNLPIAVTEVACQNFNKEDEQCSYDEIKSFMGEITSWMDQQDWVLFYCYFGFMHDMFNVNTLNRMITDDNKPNELGYQFIYS